MSGTGIAVWDSSLWAMKVAPTAVMNILPSPGDSHWTLRVITVLDKFAQIVDKEQPSEVYCEWPTYFDDAFGRVAAKEEGLTKLTYIVGCFGGICYCRSIPFILVPVREWKGQLPKDVVQKRIAQRIPSVQRLRPSSHSWDAIGIGLYAKGFFSGKG